MSHGIEIDPTNLDKAEALLGATTPICMLNLLRFHPQAQYPSSSIQDQQQPTPKLTGREAYMTGYVPVFFSIASQVSPEAGKPVFLGSPVASVIGDPSSSSSAAAAIVEGNSGSSSGRGPEEEWDMVGLISYPNLAAFRRVVECAEYKERAEGHRLASLLDWRLYAVKEFKV